MDGENKNNALKQNAPKPLDASWGKFVSGVTQPWASKAEAFTNTPSRSGIGKYAAIGTSLLDFKVYRYKKVAGAGESGDGWDLVEMSEMERSAFDALLAAKAPIGVHQTLSGTALNMDTQPFVEKPISANTTITVSGGTAGTTKGYIIFKVTGTGITATVDGQTFQLRDNGATSVTISKLLDGTYLKESGYNTSSGGTFDESYSAISGTDISEARSYKTISGDTDFTTSGSLDVYDVFLKMGGIGGWDVTIDGVPIVGLTTTGGEWNRIRIARLGGTQTIQVFNDVDEFAVLPPATAPNTPVTNDGSDSFGWTDAGGKTFADASFTTDGGSSFSPCTANPQPVGNFNFANGLVGVKYDAVPGISSESTVLYNTTPFTLDAAAPLISSMTVENATPDEVDIVFNESMATVATAASAFGITGHTVSSYSQLTATTAKLFLTAPFIASETQTGSYTQPGSNKAQDIHGNLLATTVTPITITNNVGAAGIVVDFEAASAGSVPANMSITGAGYLVTANGVLGGAKEFQVQNTGGGSTQAIYNTAQAPLVSTTTARISKGAATGTFWSGGVILRANAVTSPSTAYYWVVEAPNLLRMYIAGGSGTPTSVAIGSITGGAEKYTLQHSFNSSHEHTLVLQRDSDGFYFNGTTWAAPIANAITNYNDGAPITTPGYVGFSCSADGLSSLDLFVDDLSNV